MFVNKIIFANHAFMDAYFQSDLLGKFIFLGLLALSIGSWIVIMQKLWQTFLARKYSAQFYQFFDLQRMNPLALEAESIKQRKTPNPFFDLYVVLKKYTLEVLNKNRRFGQQNGKFSETSYLSPTDIDFVQSHLMATMANQTKSLEKNLFILSTVVSLAPFLGLLGTVWGILLTFSELQTNVAGGGQGMVLSGISLALATTVLGLMDAIPALIGYNYLKNAIRNFQIDMEGFSNELLAAVEIYYRKVDIP